MSEPTAGANPLPENGPENDTGRLDDASRARVFTVIAVVVLFAEVAPLQYTMVSPAAKIIGAHFPGVGSNISWMTIIFGLVGGAATPILGKLSDLYGKRNMLLAVGVAFAAGTLICATTTNWSLFLVGRGLEAVAIAAATIAYGLIRDLIPRRFVPLAIGLVSTGLGVSGVGGIMLSGYLTDHYSYQSMFWFLLVYTLVMTPILILVVPETKYRARQRLDPLGALMLAGGVGFALLYLSNGANAGWLDPLYLGYLGIGLLLLLAFAVVERQVAEPIIDMRLLFSPNVSNVLFLAFFASIVVGVQAYAIPYMGLSYTHDQLVQQATAPFHGLIPASEVKVIGGAGYALGLTLLGLAFHVQVWGSSVGMLSGAAAGEMSGRRGARTPLLVSMFCFAASSWIYAGDHSGWVTLAVIGVIFGVGFGGYYATTPNLLVEASPPSQQGITAGMLGVANSIGTAVGTAIAAAFQSANPLKLAVGANVSLVGTPLPGTHVVPRAEEFADKAYTGMFIACAIAGTIAFVCALLLKSGRTPSTGGLGYLARETPEQVPAVSS